MSKQSKKWLENLSPSKQLLLAYIFFWFIWLGGSIMEEKLFSTKPRSVGGHIFYATVMSLFMTIAFNWPKVRAVFKKNNEQSR
jgi:hypothetical protein